MIPQQPIAAEPRGPMGSPLDAQAQAGQMELRAASTVPENGQWERLMGQYLSDTWRVCEKRAQVCEKLGVAGKPGTGLVFRSAASELSDSKLTAYALKKAGRAPTGSHGVPWTLSTETSSNRRLAREALASRKYPCKASQIFAFSSRRRHADLASFAPHFRLGEARVQHHGQIIRSE